MYPNLKLEIWRSRIRQNRLAHELNIDETVLSKILNGYREPSSRLRTLLAEYFGKDERWLFRSDPGFRRRNGTGARLARAEK